MTLKMRGLSMLLLCGLLASCAPVRDGTATTQTPSPTQSLSPSPSPSETQGPSPSPSPSSTEDPQPTIFRFAVIGDYGSGLPAQHDVADRMCEWRGGHPFDDVITTGDNIYPDGAKEDFQRNLFEPYSCLFDAGVQFHASLGNHDFVTRRGRDVIEEPAFGMPKRNYVYRAGGVRFVMVDSNVLDREWLDEALRPRASDRWTVVAFHHPVYSTGEHGSTPGFRPSLPRLFERRGVDLVLNGHDHLYMATERLRRIVYVVTGGGGASLYECGPPRWFLARCSSRNHFLYVTAGPERITVRAVPSTGEPFHRFSTAGR